MTESPLPGVRPCWLRSHFPAFPHGASPASAGGGRIHPIRVAHRRQHDKEHETSMVFFCGIQPHNELRPDLAPPGSRRFFRSRSRGFAHGRLNPPLMRFLSLQRLAVASRFSGVAVSRSCPASALARFRASWPGEFERASSLRFCALANVGCRSPIRGDLELIAGSFSNVV